MSKVKIGLEVHIQLATESKLFCSCATKNQNEPNSSVCEICLGMPGSKPMLNKKAVEHAARMAIALGSKVADEMSFSRKTYFYPDLAKGFQITQFERPIAKGGSLDLKDRKIKITRIQIEEDPAKLVYSGASIDTSDFVFMDYNRSGTPLIELVTDPDFENPQQAHEFLDELLSILRYIGIHDEDYCTLRVDANISIEGGTRVEIKNITGFADVKKALNFEIIRQENLVRQGKKVLRETRHFDEKTGVTKSMRLKEEEEEYGYIFEPDLPRIELPNILAETRKTMPELPRERVARLQKQFRLSEHFAKVLTVQKDLGDFFEGCAKEFKNHALLANWVANDLQKCLNYQEVSIKKSKVEKKEFLKFLQKIEKGDITEREAKELIKKYVEKGGQIEKLIVKADFDLEEIASSIIKANPKVVEDFKSGKKEAMNFFVGEILKKTNFKADPKQVRELVQKRLK